MTQTPDRAFEIGDVVTSPSGPVEVKGYILHDTSKEPTWGYAVTPTGKRTNAKTASIIMEADLKRWRKRLAVLTPAKTKTETKKAGDAPAE